MRYTAPVIAIAGVAALGFGLAPAAAHAAPAPASPAAARTVAYNWWKGSKELKHYRASIRPAVWGSSFGEPVTSLRWAYWGRNSAKGKGLLVHMACQPCHVAIYLHDVKKTSHGTRYFEKARETFANHGGPIYLHWSGDWVG